MVWRSLIMRFDRAKYVVAVVAVFGCAVFVSHEYQRAREQGRTDAERDFPRWYRLFAWPEGIQNWAILLTLFAIAEQTYQTRRSADAGLEAAQAALKQIEIQQESLRPRLAIGFAKQPSSQTPYSEMVTGKRLVLHVQFINTGGIPAYGVVPETWIEYLYRPFEFTSDAIYNKGKPITVHPKEATNYSIPFDRDLTSGEIASLRSANATICLRIKLTYGALGKSVHTQEAFTIEPSYAGIMDTYSEAD